MCGIFCAVLASFPDTQCNCKKLGENIRPLLSRRGPDYSGQRRINLHVPLVPKHCDGKVQSQEQCGTVSVHFSVNVLHLRGDDIAKQPIQDDDGNILTWNGEIFSGMNVCNNDSDTTVLSKNLQCLSNNNVAEHILHTMGVIEGPWSFVYYQAQQQTLWFGRDYFGRRSMLWHHPSSPTDLFTISSVGKRETEYPGRNFWEEVPADGIYCLDLKKLSNYYLGDRAGEFSSALERHPWQHSSNWADGLILVSRILKCPVKTPFNKGLPRNFSCSSPSIKGSDSFDLRDGNRSSDGSAITHTHFTQHGEADELRNQKKEEVRSVKSSFTQFTDHSDPIKTRSINKEECSLDNIAFIQSTEHYGPDDMQMKIKNRGGCGVSDLVESMGQYGPYDVPSKNRDRENCDIINVAQSVVHDTCNEVCDRDSSADNGLPHSTPRRCPKSVRSENRDGGCFDNINMTTFTGRRDPYPARRKSKDTESSTYNVLVQSTELCDINEASFENKQGDYSRCITYTQFALCGDSNHFQHGKVGTYAELFQRGDETDRGDVPSIKNCCINQNLIEEFANVLMEAVRKRVFNLPRGKETEIWSNEICKNAETYNIEQHYKRTRVGVLFSGGLDSIVLAALADRCVPPEESIDLINVAFEQKTIYKSNSKKRSNKNRHVTKEHDVDTDTKNFNVPDRITGRNGMAELMTLNPERQWNFVEVNVTLQELQEARSQCITHLVYPQSTVLDDSIGCALWFAARGSGSLICRRCLDTVTDFQSSCSHLPSYISPAKVLLVGMGADEQLGGYARHRSRFNKEGWQGLIEEMEMEVQRISERNLGRDDRCISDHGREARYPFLDENVVSFLNGLPVWVKCDPRLPRGVGEKILLRQVAKFIGLRGSSELPKRAIQFGSRIAKLESSTEKGNEKCYRL